MSAKIRVESYSFRDDTFIIQVTVTGVEGGDTPAVSSGFAFSTTDFDAMDALQFGSMLAYRINNIFKAFDTMVDISAKAKEAYANDATCQRA